MVYKVLFSFVLNYLRKLHKVKNSDVSYDDNNYSPQGQSIISIVSAERKEGVKVGNVFATTKEPNQRKSKIIKQKLIVSKCKTTVLHTKSNFLPRWQATDVRLVENEC